MLFKENFSEKIWNILAQKQQKVYLQTGATHWQMGTCQLSKNNFFFENLKFCEGHFLARLDEIPAQLGMGRRKTNVIHIQWGSEIRTSLDFEWLKRGWVAMVRILNGIWNLEAQPSRQIAALLSKTIWNLDKHAQVLNGPVFKWLGL